MGCCGGSGGGDSAPAPTLRLSEAIKAMPDEFVTVEYRRYTFNHVVLLPTNALREIGVKDRTYGMAKRGDVITVHKADAAARPKFFVVIPQPEAASVPAVNYSELKISQLRELSSERGIDVSSRKKDDYIAALEADDNGN